MTFGCNHQFNFCHFFGSLNLSRLLPQPLLTHIDTGYLVKTTPTSVVGSLWNFAGVFDKV